MGKKARIVGVVEYREGDGPTIVIRPGLCEVEETDQDVTVNWVEGDARGLAAMPLADFRRYEASGDVVVDE
jgi:hypothetical protein